MTTEPLTGVYKTPYSTPDGAGIEANPDEGGVKVTFGNDFFTEEFLNKAPNYLVTLYENGKEVASVTLTAGEVETITTETENSCGQMEVSTESKAVVKFAQSGDSVTVKVLSADATAYYDSEASAPIPVTEPAPVAAEPAAGDAASEGNDAGSEGNGGEGSNG